MSRVHRHMWAYKKLLQFCFARQITGGKPWVLPSVTNLPSSRVLHLEFSLWRHALLLAVVAKCPCFPAPSVLHLPVLLFLLLHLKNTFTPKPIEDLDDSPFVLFLRANKIQECRVSITLWDTYIAHQNNRSSENSHVRKENKTKRKILLSFTSPITFQT